MMCMLSRVGLSIHACNGTVDCVATSSMSSFFQTTPQTSCFDTWKPPRTLATAPCPSHCWIPEIMNHIHGIQNRRPTIINGLLILNSFCGPHMPTLMWYLVNFGWCIMLSIGCWGEPWLFGSMQLEEIIELCNGNKTGWKQQHRCSTLH